MKPRTTEYVNAHQDTERLRGKASEHVCRCGQRAQEWANISGDYLGPHDYEALCVSCHRTQDLRAAHDRKQDHLWDDEGRAPQIDGRPGRGLGRRCAECRRRSAMVNYGRIKADPERWAHKQELNRQAQERRPSRAKERT
jgi:hypothetical protein